LQKLKIILQYKGFCIFLIGLSIAYVLWYKTFTNEIFLEAESIGIISELKKGTNSITIKTKEQPNVLYQYYFQNEEECISFFKKLAYGMKIKINGYGTAFSHATIPNTFDQKNYYGSLGIYTNYQVEQIEILEESKSIFYSIKNSFIKRAREDPYYSLFLVGIKEYDLTSYKNLGVSHLFSLSGMHLIFFMNMLQILLKKFKWKNSLIFFIFLLYLFILGPIPSFLRAFLFYYGNKVFLKFRIDLPKWMILGYIFFLMNLIFPYYLFNTGYLLSFVVSFGILYCQRKEKGVKALLWISVISFLYSLPIIINMNYEINVLSIFFNLLYVPFVSSYLFPLAIISFVIPFLYPLFYYSYSFMEMFSAMLEQMQLIILIPKLSWFIMVVYYGLLLLFRTKIIYFPLLCFVILSQKISFQKNYEVYFLDVGQGDCALFISPYQKEIIMVDVGGKMTNEGYDFRTANKIEIFLKSKGINKIDLLIISHGDTDHSLNALYLKDYIKHVMINQGDYNFVEQELLFLSIPPIDYQSKYFLIKQYPTKLYNNENDNSLIIQIEMLDYSFLMLGDISAEVELELLQKYKITTNVVKIAHHGSKTSSNSFFLKSLNYQIGIISVGKNYYGHPNSEVVNRVLEYGSVYTTLEYGTILFEIEERRRTISFYSP